MGEVIPLRRPKNKHIKGCARECLTEAMQATGKPKAVIITVLGENGTFAIRAAYSNEMAPFDVYARAEALAAKEKNGLMADAD